MDQELKALLAAAREALANGNDQRVIATALLFFAETLAAIAEQGVTEDGEKPLSRVARFAPPVESANASWS